MAIWQSALLRVVLFTAGMAVSLLPRFFELRMGPRLGRFLLSIDRRRSAVARENIRGCFRGLGAEEHERLLRRNFEHYGILVLELLHLFSPLPGHYRRYALRVTRLEGFENWRRANDQGRGVLFVASHLGNWEMMVAAGALGGIPLTMVTKHLKPEWLHRKVEASRLSVGVKGAYEPRTLPAVMRALRNRESVGFVMDQYAGPPIGIPVPFFGVKVGTLAAVSTLAQRTGAVIVPVKTYRDERGVVRVCVEPAMELGELIKSEEKTTEVLSGKVEDWVRQFPEQWLWIHRRFKNVVWPE